MRKRVSILVLLCPSPKTMGRLISPMGKFIRLGSPRSGESTFSDSLLSYLASLTFLWTWCPTNYIRPLVLILCRLLWFCQLWPKHHREMPLRQPNHHLKRRWHRSPSGIYLVWQRITYWNIPREPRCRLLDWQFHLSRIPIDLYLDGFAFFMAFK